MYNTTLDIKLMSDKKVNLRLGRVIKECPWNIEKSKEAKDVAERIKEHEATAVAANLMIHTERGVYDDFVL